MCVRTDWSHVRVRAEPFFAIEIDLSGAGCAEPGWAGYLRGGGARSCSQGALRPRYSPHSKPLSYIARICDGSRILPICALASPRLPPYSSQLETLRS